jgi:Flp pilus assembly protein TadD
VHSLQAYPLDVRLANAVLAYGLYLWKTVWPTGLAVFYPHPGDAISATSVSVSAAVLMLLTAVVLLQARKRPYLAVGWFWFLGTLVPVIGLVQVGNQQMADRYTYVPIVGLFIAVVWLAEPLRSAPRRASWPRAVAIAAVFAYAAAGWMQTRHWTDSVALFQQALAATGDANFVAHYNLGNAWKDRGRPQEAVKHYRKAAELRPGDSRPHNNLGVVLEQLGRPDDAIAAYRKAIRIDPENAAAHNNLGVALHQRGEIMPAIRHYQETLRIDPEDARAHNNLAMALETSGRLDEAGNEYRTAVRLDPDNPQFHNNLGVFLIVRRGQRDLAIEQFREALRLDPKFRDAAENLKHAQAR